MSKELCLASVIILSSILTIAGGLKADLFLGGKFINGHPPSIPDFIEPRVTSYGEPNVLFGRRSNVFEAEKAPSMFETFSALSGRSSIRGQKRGKNGLLPFLPKLLKIVEKNLHAGINAAVDITMGEKSKEIGEKESECESQIKKCGSTVPEKFLTCCAHCFIKGNNIFGTLAHPIADLVEQYCGAIGTVFQKIFQIAGNHFEHFRKFKTFLVALKKPQQTYKELAMNAWEAVMTSCIDLIQTDMMPFRLLSTELTLGLTNASPMDPRVDATTTNSLCLKIDGTAALTTLVDVLYRKTALVDVLLRGWATISLVKKYIPVAIQEIFAATIGAIKVVTGTACGLVEYATTGKKPECDQIGGIIVPGMPLPDDVDDSNLRPECQKDPKHIYGDPDRRRKKRSLGRGRSKHSGYYEGAFNRAGGARGIEIPHKTRELPGRFGNTNPRHNLMVGRERRGRNPYSGRIRGYTRP